jgi:hypothetical protein
METANKIVRRIFAWPLTLIGVALVQLGGGLLQVAAWILDIDTSEVWDES